MLEVIITITAIVSDHHMQVIYFCLAIVLIDGAAWQHSDCITNPYTSPHAVA